MSQDATPTTSATAASTASTPQAAAANGPKGSPAGDEMSSQVSSLADLKAQAPKVYKAMMEGIAMNICNEMKQHQDRLKQMMDEARRGS